MAMPSRTPWLSAWFPVVALPLIAQRATPVDRQLVAAGIWAEARYNYAYWDAVHANWDSAFAATVTYAEARPAHTDLQFYRRLRRWGALLNDGQLEIIPPASIANRIARPPLALRSIERSEEHTSELQSLRHLVCRLLLEKKKNTHYSCIELIQCRAHVND